MNNATQWLLGVISALIIGFGSYGIAAIASLNGKLESMDVRMDTLEITNSSRHEVLKSINQNLTTLNALVKEKFDAYDVNVNSFYKRGPVFRADLERAIANHSH
jgi:uncharacterized coiled-coil protein SlyX